MTRKRLIDLMLDEYDESLTPKNVLRYADGSIVDRNYVNETTHFFIHQSYMVARRGRVVFQNSEEIIPIVLEVLINPPHFEEEDYELYLFLLAEEHRGAESFEDISQGWMDACVFVFPEKTEEIVLAEVRKNRNSWTPVLTWVRNTGHPSGKSWVNAIFAESSDGNELTLEQKYLVEGSWHEITLMSTPMRRGEYARRIVEYLSLLEEPKLQVYGQAS